MINENNYSKSQLTLLLVLRFVIGWHILYEGISKILNPQWTSANFLQESQGILSGLSGWIISNPNILVIVDFMNIWGLVTIGLGLIFGFLFKPAAIIGSFLVFIYYLSVPPMVGYEYTLPSDGSNLVVNRTLIEAVVLFGLALFPTSKIFGLDFFIYSRDKRKLQYGKNK